MIAKEHSIVLVLVIRMLLITLFTDERFNSLRFISYLLSGSDIDYPGNGI